MAVSYSGISLWDPCYDLLCIMPPLSHRKIVVIPYSITFAFSLSIEIQIEFSTTSELTYRPVI